MLILLSGVIETLFGRVFYSITCLLDPSGQRSMLFQRFEMHGIQAYFLKSNATKIRKDRNDVVMRGETLIILPTCLTVP
jgi:hypothetical protein